MSEVFYLCYFENALLFPSELPDNYQTTGNYCLALKRYQRLPLKVIFEVEESGVRKKVTMKLEIDNSTSYYSVMARGTTIKFNISLVRKSIKYQGKSDLFDSVNRFLFLNPINDDQMDELSYSDFDFLGKIDKNI